jgi:hypothetical protein
MLRSLRSLSLALAVAGLLAPAAANAAPVVVKAGTAKSKKASSKKTSSKKSSKKSKKKSSKKKSSKKKSSKKKSSKKKSHKVTYPTVSRVRPMAAGIGDKLVLKGKGYKSGKAKNYVVFKRDKGRALFVKADKATSTQITVTIPAKLLGFLTQKAGVPVATRFHLRVMATRLAKSYTKTGLSPLISAKSGSGAGLTDDCDSDGIPNAKDADDDNDLLPDTEEARIKTDPCKPDSDGDGMSDGWEVQSAKDRNGGTYPASKPSPNPRDNGDAAIDADGDGLTNLEEYTAWATFGGHALPLSYSGGNAASAGRGPVPAALKYMDRDGNGFLSDLERDADGDGIPNMDEGRGDGNPDAKDLARLVTSQAETDRGVYDFGIFNVAYLRLAETQSRQDPLQCAGINQVPFYCVDKVSGGTIGVIDVQKVDTLDWLSSDTDGDGVSDDNDDVDHDGRSNMAEYMAVLTLPYSKRKLAPLDACVPSIDDAACLIGTGDIDGDGTPNAQDGDADGDGLSNDLEASIGTNPLMADTDRDGVSDAFEYNSAMDLNKNAFTGPPPEPSYPYKRPYPNPLDGSDATLDFDQDGMTQKEEYAFWLASSCWDHSASKATTASCNLAAPMSYSDGKQASDPLSMVKDGERDADGDGLSNWTEAHGPLSGPEWWDAYMGVDANRCGPNYTESTYPGPKYLGLDPAERDTDDDGVDDGADDVDHDGWTNAQEQTRPGLFTNKAWCGTYVSTDHPGSDPIARMQPFNPCKPTYSSACHVHPPIGYYDPQEDWKSPDAVDGP